MQRVLGASQEEEQQPLNRYVLLAGLPQPQMPLLVAPGLTLRPLNAPLSVFDLAAAGAAGFRMWAMLEPLADGCTCEIEAVPSATTLSGLDTLGRAWLVSALLVLRGFTGHVGVASSAYPWNMIAGRSKQKGPDLPPFRGRILDFHLRVFTGGSSRQDTVNQADAEWILSHFDSFNRLASESSAFRLALEAAIDWRFFEEPPAAVGRLWSGIEAIFGISSELVYRISTLSASLLEPRGATRKHRFKEVKDLYALRSKAVHGEPLSSKQLAQAMTGSFKLLQDLLLLSIERGHALDSDDFDKAVFY